MALSVAYRSLELVAGPILFLRTDITLSDKIRAALTAVHCLDNGYVAMQPVAWKELVKRTPGKNE